MSPPPTADGPFNQTLAELLHDLRMTAGLSQEVLATELRWDQATVSRIETGRRRVEVAELLAWVHATNSNPNLVLRQIDAAWRRTAY
ncbi:helix-turn-helix domain-containing protein [Terrabacter sp. 2TAF16]|uniref:helix-turn-helix domain-containing protein n=1 Tax=Terrabacter sp. 2TAF16 TaxID=3233008 RepID=UPI003F951601